MGHFNESKHRFKNAARNKAIKKAEAVAKRSEAIAADWMTRARLMQASGLGTGSPKENDEATRALIKAGLGVRKKVAVVNKAGGLTNVIRFVPDTTGKYADKIRERVHEEREDGNHKTVVEFHRSLLPQFTLALMTLRAEPEKPKAERVRIEPQPRNYPEGFSAVATVARDPALEGEISAIEANALLEKWEFHSRRDGKWIASDEMLASGAAQWYSSSESVNGGWYIWNHKFLLEELQFYRQRKAGKLPTSK